MGSVVLTEIINSGVVIASSLESGQSIELDLLLWQVLWEPFGLLRHVRHHFAVDGEEIELAALCEGKVIGGALLVITETSAELRHLAVHPEYQMRGVGRMLVEAACHWSAVKSHHLLRTYARNSSRVFFEKLLFKAATEERLYHPLLSPHNIFFYEMIRPLSPLL